MGNDPFVDAAESASFPLPSTVNTAYSVIGYSAKSDMVSTLGWYGIPYTNNYWI